jgi:hypothetical protein
MLIMSSTSLTHLLILTTLTYFRSISGPSSVFLLLMTLSLSLSIPPLEMPLLLSTPSLLSATASLLLLSSLPLELRKIFLPSILMIPGRNPTSCSSMHGTLGFLTLIWSSVNVVDTRLFKEKILKGFHDLVSLYRVLHMIPAEASNGYVAVVFHVLILLAEKLNAGLGVLAVKREGNEEIVMDKKIILLGFERYLEELAEARGFFQSNLDFEGICSDVAMFFGFAV